MRLKTKYRKYRDGGRVDAVEPRQDEMPPEQTEPLKPVALEQTAEASPEPPAAPEPLRQDDATLQLKRQIESLRQSEQHQRQQAAQPPQDMTREQRLEAWRAQGLSAAEAHFLQRHPEMVDFPQVTNFAVHRANEAGLSRGTDEYFAEVEKIFNASLAHLQQAQANPQESPMPEPPAEFSAPPPAPRSAPNPVRYSAPVSRDIPGSGSGRRHTPGRVTLSPSEVEAARNSGISPEEYARQKIRYQNMREDGSYSDARDLK